MPWFLSSAALAFTADFDTFPEGANAPTFTEDQLLFRDVDNRYAPTVFAIEQADNTLGGQPGFTPRNALGFGGYSSGPDAAFGRFGSMVIEPPVVSTDAELSVYSFGGYPNVGLRLEARRNGAVVGSDSVALPNFVLGASTLRVSVPAGFDELSLVVGPNPTDVAFLLVDHVVVDGGTPTEPTGDTAAPAPTGDTGVAEVEHTGEEPPEHTGGHSAWHSGTGEPDDTGDPGPDDEVPDTDQDPTVDDGGCGCATPGSAAGLAPLLLVLAIGRRRR